MRINGNNFFNFSQDLRNIGPKQATLQIFGKNGETISACFDNSAGALEHLQRVEIIVFDSENNELETVRNSNPKELARLIQEYC